MHFIPMDQHACAVLAQATLRVNEGDLPSYATFVDNLFKELPMANMGDVLQLISEASGPDRKLSMEQVTAALTEMAENPNASAMHAAIGCAGEGGELLDCVKKVFIYRKRWDQVDAKTGQTPTENLLEELGDFRFYYQKLLNMLGLRDEDIQHVNMAKLAVRYAAGKYSDAAAQQRADKDVPVPAPRSFFGKPDNKPEQHEQRRKEDKE